MNVFLLTGKNLLLDEDFRQVKVADFGAAKSIRVS